MPINDNKRWLYSPGNRGALKAVKFCLELNCETFVVGRMLRPRVVFGRIITSWLILCFASIEKFGFCLRFPIVRSVAMCCYSCWSDFSEVHDLLAFFLMKKLIECDCKLGLLADYSSETSESLARSVWSDIDFNISEVWC